MKNGLSVKKINSAKFPHPAGYATYSGFGIYHEVRKAWVSFNGETPYVPVGGRNTAVSVAKTVDVTAVSFVSEIES